MRKVGNHMVKLQEEGESINNEAEIISGKLNLEGLVGKTIECKIENSVHLFSTPFTFPYF
jgi:hypothetical protein